VRLLTSTPEPLPAPRVAYVTVDALRSRWRSAPDFVHGDVCPPPQEGRLLSLCSRERILLVSDSHRNLDPQGPDRPGRPESSNRRPMPSRPKPVAGRGDDAVESRRRGSGNEGRPRQDGRDACTGMERVPARATAEAGLAFAKGARRAILRLYLIPKR